MTRNATKSLISIAIAAALVAGLVPTGPSRMAHAEDGTSDAAAVEATATPRPSDEAAEKSTDTADAAAAGAAANAVDDTEAAAADDTVPAADGASATAEAEPSGQEGAPEAGVADEKPSAASEAVSAEAAAEGGAAGAAAEAASPEDKASERPAIDAVASATNGVIVEVHAPEGAFEAGTTLRVSTADANELAQAAAPLVGGRAGDARAVDISFVRDGAEVEPAAGHPVSVSLRSLFAAGGSSFKAVHLSDDGTAELVGDATATSADFSATSFSVYGIVGEAGEKRVQVTFESASTDGAMLATQIVHEGDTLTAPDAPVSPDAGKAFECWRAGTTDISGLLGSALDADAITRLAALGTSTEEENTYALKVYASFATARAVRLHQFPYDPSPTAGTDDVYADTLYALAGADGVFRADLSKASFTAVAAANVSLMGWERREGGEVAQDYDKSATIEVDGPVDLYPKMSSGHWVSLDTGDAPKVDALFVPEGETLAASALPAATWQGYRLEGWYLDAEHTQKVPEDITPTEGLTLHANWLPADNTRYHVLLWVEGAEGGPGEGTYGLHSTYECTGTTGEVLKGVPTSDAKGYVVDGATYKIDMYHPRTGSEADEGQTVKADGTTILNLYYARDWWRVIFKNGSTTVLNAGNVKWGQDVSYWFNNSTISDINTRWNATNIGMPDYTTVCMLSNRMSAVILRSTALSDFSGEYVLPVGTSMV